MAPGCSLGLAYADPPYPGKAWLHRDHPDYGGEVDHAALIAQLAEYDGWALSTSVLPLPAVLALCPPGVRVAAWHRDERPTRSWWPLHAWEPVLYHGGRQLVGGPRRADSLVCGVGPLDTLPGQVIGAKPAAVCRWIFTCSALRRGTGSMTCSPGLGQSAGRGLPIPAAIRRFPAAADASCKARADASSPAAGNGLDPSGEALDDGCPFPLEAAR